jgi:hypothetical protein
MQSFGYAQDQADETFEAELLELGLIDPET